MAWNIPQELMNNNPLPIEEVKKRYEEHGLKLLDFDYKNNLTKLCCEDQDGYKVMASLSSLGKVKQYTRFSTICNEDNFMYNVDLYRNQNNIPSKILFWEKSKIKNHIDVTCKCECGNIFKLDFGRWRSLEKVRCNDCTRKISQIEYDVRQWLIDNNIDYIEQYKFDNCRNIKPLPFDFYLPDYNICIEVDGEQHFYDYSLKYFKGDKWTKEDFENRQKLDNIKTNYCNDNNINLIRLKYNIVRNGEFKNILKEQIHTD